MVACLGEIRLYELWRACEIVTSRLAKYDAFVLPRIFMIEPEVRALLLVEIIDHDLMFDVF
jgi:hypothetical protein